MAPFPEEVDVFSGPHSRMKTLVEVYSEKLRKIDFSEPGNLEPLLDTLLSTFYEFKSHEQIENRFIMRRLKKKMKDLRITDAAVCNCHSDNQLSDMISLLRDGYGCSLEEDRVEYGRKLQQALDAFTDDFLPHMKEEEEVFQPLLVKYFEYEELCSLKQLVMLEHAKSQCTSPAEPSDSVTTQSPQPDTITPVSEISKLPPELLEHIFSFLGPMSLVRCGAVCQSWREVALQPRLWRVVQPCCWAQDLWEDPLGLPAAPYRPLCYRWEPELHPDPPETQVLYLLANNLLPHVGPSVRKLVLSGFQRVPLELLRSLLAQCPNITHLDLSFTALSDTVFKGLEGIQPPLEWLSLAGCIRLTDSGLSLLAQYLGSSPALSHLSLSGCLHISDHGLGYLGRQLRAVQSLDLSGCWRLTGTQLKVLTSKCPKLQPGELAYCDFICDGPFPTSASGCQNLETQLCCKCSCQCEAF